MNAPPPTAPAASRPGVDIKESGTAAERREAPPGGGGPLPCLYSHNYDKASSRNPGSGVKIKRERTVVWNPDGTATVTTRTTFPDGKWQEVQQYNQAKVNLLSPGHRRTAFCVAWEIAKAAEKYGLERLVFLTLTFEDDVQVIREAQRRFKNLYRGVFRRRYGRMIGCWERTKAARIHFHLVVVMPFDCLKGFNFAEVANKALPRKTRYRSVGKSLRWEWAYLRRTLPKYKFGRAEMMPIKSTAEGIARYAGKYVAKHIDGREEADKGAKTVRFIGFKPEDRTCSSRFSWATPNHALWRAKSEKFAAGIGCQTLEDMKALFGPRWCYFLQHEIFQVELKPTLRAHKREVRLLRARVKCLPPLHQDVHWREPLEPEWRVEKTTGLSEFTAEFHAQVARMDKEAALRMGAAKT
jgi:hypothetical protein